MNFAARILVGALAGWLTGKAAGEEGAAKVSNSGRAKLRDIIYGILGALMGDYLFFWAVIGAPSSFSSYATAVLGAVTLVGVARLVAARIRHTPGHS
ncbi:MAG: GlsB/YeaQ/YmgE family stress response membrane protein [Candidatus Binatia bacterium]